MYNIGAEKANDLKDQSVIKDGKCDLERWWNVFYPDILSAGTASDHTENWTVDRAT
jgi:hypothetical protein